MTMRPTDPLPPIDPSLPEWQQVLARIQIELILVRREFPELPPRAQLQEARRRSAKPMVAAVDALEARRIVDRLNRRFASRLA
jgi:hypothetical protein